MRGRHPGAGGYQKNHQIRPRSRPQADYPDERSGHGPGKVMRNKLNPIRWKSGTLFLLEQRLLPLEEKWVRCDSAEKVARAIEDMTVRGAPAIGITAAYG